MDTLDKEAWQGTKMGLKWDESGIEVKLNLPARRRTPGQRRRSAIAWPFLSLQCRSRVYSSGINRYPCATKKSSNVTRLHFNRYPCATKKSSNVTRLHFNRYPCATKKSSNVTRLHFTYRLQPRRAALHASDQSCGLLYAIYMRRWRAHVYHWLQETSTSSGELRPKKSPGVSDR